MDELLRNDLDEICYVLRWVCRSLAALQVFIEFLYWYGVGSAGKDCVTRLFLSLLGDGPGYYGVSESDGCSLCDVKTLYNPNGPSPKLLSWKGKRAVVFAEIPKKPLNMDMINPLCDGQRQVAGLDTFSRS